MAVDEKVILGVLGHRGICSAAWRDFIFTIISPDQSHIQWQGEFS